MRHNIFQKYYHKLNQGHSSLSYPSIIDVELTNICNLSCGFCRTTKSPRKKGSMSIDILKKIVDESRGHDCGIRFIRWGEPTMYEDLDLAISLVDEAGIPLHITTNGQKYHPMLSEVDSLTFSFQGASPEEYETQRLGAKYDKIASTIQNVVDERGDSEKPYIQITMTTTYADSVESIAAFKAYWGAIVDNLQVGYTIYYEKTKQGGVCKDLYNKVAVDWDGTVTACCADYNNEMSLGSLKDASLASLWQFGMGKYRTLHECGMGHSLTLCSTCEKGHKIEKNPLSIP